MQTAARFPAFVLLSVLAHGVALVSSRLPSAAPPPLGDTAKPLRISLLKPVRDTTPSTVSRQPVVTASSVRPRQSNTKPVTPVSRTRAVSSQRTAKSQQTVVAKPPALATVQTRTSDNPPVMAASTQPALSSAQLRNRISNALTRRLRAQFNYPWLARKRGWQGHVTLSLRIEQDGQLSHIQVARTSGHRILDNSALHSATRIGALTEVAGLMHGQSLELMIPVYYRLLDG